MQNYGVFGDSDAEDAGRYPLKLQPVSNTGGRNSEASTRKSRFTRENICGQISSSKEPSFTQCSIQSTSAKFRAMPKHDTFSAGENPVLVRPKTPPSDPALLRKTKRSLVRAKAWVHHSDSQIALKEKSKINTGMAAQTGIMNFRRESAETDVNYRQTFTKVYKQCKASDRISFQHLNKIATTKRKVHEELRKTVKQTKTTSSQQSISDPPDVAAKNSFDAEQRGNKNIVVTERTTSVSCPSRKDSSEIELPQVAAICKRKIICEVLKRVDTDENCSKSLTEDHVELPEGKDRREPSNHFSLTTATHSKFSNENRPTLECKEKFVDEHEMKSFPYFEVSDLSDDLSGKSEETEFNEGKDSMPKDSTLFSSETSPAELVCDKLKLRADVDVSDDKITIKVERKSEGSGPQQDENELGDVTSYVNKACAVSSLTGPTMKSQQRGEEISQIPSSSFEDLDEDWLHFTYTRQRQSQNCETGKDSTSPTKDGVSLKTRASEQRSEPTGTSCKRCACNVFSTLFTILLLLAVLLLIYFQVLGDPYNLAKLLGFASDEKNTTFVTETGTNLKPTYDQAISFTSTIRFTDIDYLQEYSIPEASSHKILARRLESQITSIFSRSKLNSTFRSATLLNFANGSLIANLRLSFQVRMGSTLHLPAKEEVATTLLRGTCVTDRDEHGGGEKSNEAQPRCSVHMIGAHRVDQNSLRYVNDDGCGKTTTLASPYGVVASANWGVGYYLPHQRCEWYLLGREGTIARLKVVAFNTEKDFDTVSIFEGVETDRSLTARLSGQYPRDQFLLIPSSSVSITFVSDGVVQKPGFVFAYDFMNNNFPPSTGCDNENVIFTSPSGAFTSSGYPRLYPNYLRCQWKIMVDPDKVVKIHFVDFKTRDSRDFLRIFVDKDNTTTLFDSFYGEQSGRDVITDSNRVTILFVSDSQLRDRGFHVTYSSEEPIRCWEQHECGSGKCIPSQYVCDGTIDCAEGSDEMECDSNCSGPAKRNVSSDSEVVLTSMNYPNNYEPSSNCGWMISAYPTNLVLQLNVTDFSTETLYDVLLVYNGIGRNKTLLASLDGKRTSEVIMTSSNRLTISFVSDDTVQSRGFYISITASEPGLCPGRFTCDGGECVLKDWVCDGTVDCKDGSDERSCDSGCGGLAEVVDESYVTSYMDVMEKYEDNSNCVWRIRSPDPDKLVSISFNRFATEEKFDILKIYNGVGRNKTIKVSYSGVIKPPDYVSTTSDVTILFTSDGSVTGPGFNFSVTWIDGGPCPGRFHCAESSCLDWSKVCDETDDCPGGEDEISCPSGCESLRDRKVAGGQLSSLYHPRYYPDNLRCLWRIKAESNQLIQLKFNFFNTEENVDLLKVFNGFGREKRLSGWFSGTRTPTVFRSRYHQITLQFTSDQSVNRPGFNISYKMALPKNLPACGGNQTIPVPLGMESGKIRNRQITSSSVLTGHWAAHNARLRNSRNAWASSVTQPKRLQWLQIDFEKASLLTGVAVQGFRAGRDFYVTSFVIHYSVDGKNWVKYTSRLSLNAKVFSGNNGSFSIKHHDFDHPFVTRFLRIIPRTWVGSCTVLRTEVYGCEDLGQLKPSQQGCSENNFECSDGSCILREAYCDGVIDCDDGSDERRCSGCRWNEIECFSGECVPSTARCDGNRDCRDGSDEFQCSSCGEDDFLCADESACISRKWRCDGFKDCLDMSDEQGCGHGWLCNVSSNFRCNDGGCVSGINVMCNDVTECQDHSDEALCDCGIKDPRDEAKSNNTRLNQELVHRVPRIVGGTASEPHSWPWQVSLRRSVGGAHFCGATLVGREWLVTAAHCLVGVTRENVKAKVGLHYRVSDSQPTRDMDVKEIYMHPRYDDQTYDFDVALLRLKTPVTFSDEISPICVPPFTHMFHPDQKCWITGWGSSYKDGPGSDLLQEVEVTIMTSSICNRPMWYAGKITPRMFCAGHITGKADSCQGDSGGPLACQERGNGRWFLAGIVSWGSGCGNLFKPGVYTKVTEVSHWLKEIMSEDST